MSIRVTKPGLLTTLQDLGRYGYQNQGVIVGGAMDTFALRMANILTGNPQDEAGIEITLSGPEFLFEEDLLIALCGAGFQPFVENEPLALWRAAYIKKGSRMTFKPERRGCRLYLSVSGGLSIDKILESKSTYLRAGFGGYQGRALKAGDVLKTVSKNKAIQFPKLLNFSLAKKDFTDYPERLELRAMRGPEFNWFDEKIQKMFFQSSFKLSTKSDRMGFRLEGETLKRNPQKELLSTAVTKGTVQVPPDGNLILLMADCQTTGGYPRIAQLASVDQPLAAQLKPGDTITFKEISQTEAEQLLLERERKIEAIQRTISLKRE